MTNKLEIIEIKNYRENKAEAKILEAKNKIIKEKIKIYKKLYRNNKIIINTHKAINKLYKIKNNLLNVDYAENATIRAINENIDNINHLTRQGNWCKGWNNQELEKLEAKEKREAKNAKYKN